MKMIDSQWVCRKLRPVFALAIPALVLAGAGLFAGPVQSAQGPEAGEDESAGFGVHCWHRSCQFWLTDPDLMLRNEIDLQWNFGDGQQEDQMAPMHHFKRPGRYTAELEVVDPDGSTRTFEQTLVLGLNSNWLLESSPAGMGVIEEMEEGFDNVNELTDLGWFIQNNSDPVGFTDWFQGIDDVFFAHEGPSNSYVMANFENVDEFGTISNWLLTPELLLDSDTEITFWTRTMGESEPDRLQVRLSLEGGSVNVGTGAEDVGDFTELLLDINPELIADGYPEEWAPFTLDLEGVPGPATGRIGFRYYVTNAGQQGENSAFIGIDTFSVVQPEGVAEPPLINDGDGIEDQTVIAGDMLFIDFQVSDPVDDPADLFVDFINETPGVIPDEDIDLLAIDIEGGLWSLQIQTNPDVTGEALLFVEVMNLSEISTFEEVVIDIQEPPEVLPPLINDGLGFDPVVVDAGEIVEVEFTVEDPQGLPVFVGATSQNQDLIADDNIDVQLVGEGKILTYILTAPTAADEFGTVVIDVQAVNSEEASTTEELVVTIEGEPSTPLINDGAGIANQSVTAGDTLSVAFQVSDPEFAPEDLETDAASGNPALLPDNALSIQGTGGTRTLVIETLAGNSGTAPILVSVANPAGGSSVATFDLEITDPLPPQINDGEPLDDLEVIGGDPLSVDFVVDDPVDDPSDLEVMATSSNPGVIAEDGLTLSGTGAARSLDIQTQPGVLGSSTITIAVTNTSGQTTTSEFLVTVVALPTSLALDATGFALPSMADRLVMTGVENTGQAIAYQVLLEAAVPESYEIVGVFVLATACAAEGGAVSCAIGQTPDWQCEVFSGAVSCTLAELPPGGDAAVVIRASGEDGGLVPVVVEAINAPIVDAEAELVP